MTRLFSALAALCFTTVVAAEEPETVDVDNATRGMVCDTLDQVKGLYKIVDSGSSVDDATQQINASAHRSTCAVSTIAYHKRKIVDFFVVGKAEYDIWEIQILYVFVRGNWVKINSVYIQYAPFPAITEKS